MIERKARYLDDSCSGSESNGIMARADIRSQYGEHWDPEDLQDDYDRQRLRVLDVVRTERLEQNAGLLPIPIPLVRRDP